MHKMGRINILVVDQHAELYLLVIFFFKKISFLESFLFLKFFFKDPNLTEKILRLRVYLRKINKNVMTPPPHPHLPSPHCMKVQFPHCAFSVVGVYHLY